MCSEILKKIDKLFDIETVKFKYSYVHKMGNDRADEVFGGYQEEWNGGGGPQPLPAGWFESSTPEGKTYYYKLATRGDSQWERPTEPRAQARAQYAREVPDAALGQPGLRVGDAREVDGRIIRREGG